MSEKFNSITDVFSSVFLLVRKRDDGTYGVLLTTPARSLQDELLPFDKRKPGTYRFQWSKDELKEVSLLLRGLGFYVFLYEISALQDWASPFLELPINTMSVWKHLPEIAESLPESQSYVEVFGGRTPLFLARAPSPVEVLNDYSRAIVSFYHVVRDPSLFSWVYLLSQVVPPSNSYLPEHLSIMWENLNDEDAVLASYAWYLYVRGALPEGERHQLSDDLPDSVSGKVLSSLCAVDPDMVELYNRLYRVQVEHNTIEKVIQINDSPDTLFWVDPPFEGIGALDKDGTFDLIHYLNTLSGTVALYGGDSDQNPHVRLLMRSISPWNHWKRLRFGSSTVYLKQCTEDA